MTAPTAAPVPAPWPPRLPDDWPHTPAEAVALQQRLAPAVVRTGPGPAAVATVAGLDVAYADDGSDRLAAAVVVLDAATLDVVARATAVGTTAFPYVPGLFAFRELPALLTALGHLDNRPDLLLCDGQGYAHPRRFGLACHLGLLTGLPSIGVGKTPLVGTGPGAGLDPAPERGAWAPVEDGGEVVGRALRTRTGVKPVYVSVGHGLDLDAACRHVLAVGGGYRLPEPIRAADHLSRTALAAASRR